MSFSIMLRMPYHCDRYSCASRLQVPLSPHISRRNWTARCGLMGTLSAYLSKACARAQVPRLHTSNNWRQISASVGKEKFSNKERANFELEENAAEELGTAGAPDTGHKL
jgi:hypothetical protein